MAPERRNIGARKTTITRERLGKHIVSATAVTSRNTRRAARSDIATRSGDRRTVPLQWNTRYNVTHKKKEPCFLLGPLQRPVSPSQEPRDSAGRQTSPSLRLLWDNWPCWRRGRRRSTHCFKSLRRSAELVMRYSPASNDANMEAKKRTALEAVTRQPVKTTQTKKIYCVL
jgi:hypothetical protein